MEDARKFGHEDIVEYLEYFENETRAGRKPYKPMNSAVVSLATSA